MPDQLVILRPDQVVASSWGWDLAPLVDDSDSTWQQTAGPGETVLGFPSPSIPLGAKIISVRPRFRGKSSTSSTAKGRYRLSLAGVDTALLNLSWSFGATAVAVGATHPSAPNGQAWDVARVGAIEVKFSERPETLGNIQLFELYLYVFYNRRPTVAVTGPVDEDPGTAGVQVTSTQQPSIAWTFTDEDSDTQRAYELKVFTEATYLAGGFDPASSQAAYASGVVYNSAVSVTTGTLSHGFTYRAYMRVYDGVQWSNWAQREFSVGTDPSITPSAPTLSVVADSANAPPRVELIVTPQGTNPSEAVTVERQNDDGTWHVVVNRSPGSGPQVLYDYGALPIASTYRARTHIGTLASGWSASATSGALAVTQWWLVDRLSPELSVTLRLRQYPIRTSRSRVGVFYPLGPPPTSRSRAVSIADSVTAEVLDLNLGFDTDADYEAFDALRRTQRPLLLRDPRKARQWWVVLSGDRQANWIGREDLEAQDVTVQATEVKEPV